MVYVLDFELSGCEIETRVGQFFFLVQMILKHFRENFKLKKMHQQQLA